MAQHAPGHGDQGTDDGVIAIDSDDAEGLFGALSSATARSILAALHDESMTPSEIADAADTSLQNVNHHLDQLQGADLVEVIGTTTSEQGREMKEYGPATDALVLHAGNEGTGGQEPERDTAAPDSTGPDERWDSGPDVVDPASGSSGSTARAFLLGVLVSIGAVVVLRLLTRD